MQLGAVALSVIEGQTVAGKALRARQSQYRGGIKTAGEKNDRWSHPSPLAAEDRGRGGISFTAVIAATNTLSRMVMISSFQNRVTLNPYARIPLVFNRVASAVKFPLLSPTPLTRGEGILA